MTDNEIIKALECCFGGEGLCPRQQCPFYEKCKNDESLAMYALDLIKRQKAEIERLKAEADMADGYADALEERAKSEAIKEFAERLKEKVNANEWNGTICGMDIDNLVKEMTEDEGK